MVKTVVLLRQAVDLPPSPLLSLKPRSLLESNLVGVARFFKFASSAREPGEVGTKAAAHTLLLVYSFACPGCIILRLVMHQR